MECCPACDSSLVSVGPASSRTERKTGACRPCGAHFLVDLPATAETISVAEVPTDFVDHYVDIKREGVGPEVWRRELSRLTARLPAGASLYDVGSGDGEFLQVARDEFGFRVSGNDILESAVVVARQNHGIDLDLGDLSGLGHEDAFDAVTMWCVLAHVPDGEVLLQDVRRMLRPGGLLFLQTPHYTAADRVFVGLKRATGGRVTRLADRRLAGHHRILHTRRSITALLERVGFEDVEVEPSIRYSLSSRAYLDSLRMPAWVAAPAARTMDTVIERGLAPRIVLDVHARKPR